MFHKTSYSLYLEMGFFLLILVNEGNVMTQCAQVNEFPSETHDLVKFT